jgi:hypothetical protein
MGRGRKRICRATTDRSEGGKLDNPKHPLFVFCMFLLASGAILGACQPQAIAEDELRDGVLATFEVDGEEFKVWVTNRDTLQQLFDLQAGTSSASIPNGRILRGAGKGNHNASYHWHLDPEDIEMAEMTIELCDGRPSYVEEHLDEFVDTVQRYCPWAAKLVSLEDFRIE